MKRLALRSVALCLIPGLFADPALASAIARVHAPSAQVARRVDPYADQAIIGRLGAHFLGVMNKQSHLRLVLLLVLIPLPGLAAARASALIDGGFEGLGMAAIIFAAQRLGWSWRQAGFFATVAANFIVMAGFLFPGIYESALSYDLLAAAALTVWATVAAILIHGWQLLRIIRRTAPAFRVWGLALASLFFLLGLGRFFSLNVLNAAKLTPMEHFQLTGNYVKWSVPMLFILFFLHTGLVLYDTRGRSSYRLRRVGA